MARCLVLPRLPERPAYQPVAASAVFSVGGDEVRANAGTQPEIICFAASPWFCQAAAAAALPTRKHQHDRAFGPPAGRRRFDRGGDIVG